MKKKIKLNFSEVFVTSYRFRKNLPIKLSFWSVVDKPSPGSNLEKSSSY